MEVAWAWFVNPSWFLFFTAIVPQMWLRWMFRRHFLLKWCFFSHSCSFASPKKWSVRAQSGASSICSFTCVCSVSFQLRLPAIFRQWKTLLIKSFLFRCTLRGQRIHTPFVISSSCQELLGPGRPCVLKCFLEHFWKSQEHVNELCAGMKWLQMIQDMLVLLWGMNSTDFSPEVLKCCNPTSQRCVQIHKCWLRSYFAVAELLEKLTFCFQSLLGCLQNSKSSLLLALTLENLTVPWSVEHHLCLSLTRW